MSQLAASGPSVASTTRRRSIIERGHLASRRSVHVGCPAQATVSVKFRRSAGAGRRRQRLSPASAAIRGSSRQILRSRHIVAVLTTRERLLPSLEPEPRSGRAIENTSRRPARASAASHRGWCCTGGVIDVAGGGDQQVILRRDGWISAAMKIVGGRASWGWQSIGRMVEVHRRFLAVEHDEPPAGVLDRRPPSGTKASSLTGDRWRRRCDRPRPIRHSSEAIGGEALLEASHREPEKRRRDRSQVLVVRRTVGDLVRLLAEAEASWS